MARLISEDALVVASIDKLRGRYAPLAGIVSGSAAYRPHEALDFDFCIIVEDDVCDRVAIRIDEVSVDLFVCGATRVKREIEQGHQPHLLRLFAEGRHVFGDPSISNHLIAVALDVLAGDARALSPAAAFTIRGRPHNLLRKFASLRFTDRSTAALTAVKLIQDCVEAFFALRQIWPDGIRQTLSAIRDRDSASGNALERALNADLTALTSDMTILEDLVRTMVGDDNAVDEMWIVQGGRPINGNGALDS